MSLPDQRKAWYFTLSAAPNRCVAAFLAAFDGERGGGRLLPPGNWKLEPRVDGALATYVGRAGVAKFLTKLSGLADDEERAALGSEILFEVRDAPSGRVRCSMSLNSRSTSYGFATDARFFRPYMREVETQLRQLDENVEVLDAT